MISEKQLAKQTVALSKKMNLFCVKFQNEGKRSWYAGKELGLEGVVAGIPDYVIFANNTCYFLELKAEKGVVSKKQMDVLNHLSSLGYKTKVARSLQEVCEYFMKISKNEFFMEGEND